MPLSLNHELLSLMGHAPQPRPYQQQDAEWLMQGVGRVLANDPGLGKTLTAIQVLQHSKGPHLIIAPTKLKEWWEFELMRATLRWPEQPKIYVSLRGGVIPKIEDDENAIVITHYEGVRLYPVYRLMDWGVLICDEAHRLRNRKTQTHHAVSIVRLRAKRAILLTATPIEKNLTDLWGLLHVCDPDKFRSYWAFVNRYFLQIRNRYTIETFIQKKETLDEFNQLLATYVRQRKKTDVAPELPPLTETYVPVAMHSVQRALYDDIAQSVLVELFDYSDVSPEWKDELKITSALARMVRLQQVAVWPPLINAPITAAKMQWLEDWLADNNEPVVIFTNFRELAIEISSTYKLGLVVGGVEPQLQGFYSGKQRGVVCTIAAGGEGLNLDRATTAIFMDVHRSATKMRQAVERIHRLTTTVPKQVIYLVAENSVDGVLCRAIKHKWSNAELLSALVRRLKGDEHDEVETLRLQNAVPVGAGDSAS